MNDKRRKYIVGIKQIVVIGVLVVAGLALTVMYNDHIQKEKIEAERQAEETRLKRERAEEAARAQRQKEEEEAKEAEEKRRAEQEAREKAQREREEAEREQARKAAEEEAARQKKIETENKRREVYNTARDLFKSALYMEEEAPPSEKILSAKAGSKFWFIFDTYPTEKLIYEVYKASYSRMEVKTLSLEADAKDVPYLDFIRLVNGRSYIYTSGDKVWLKCEKNPEGSYPVPKRGRDFCVAAKNSFALYKTLLELGTKSGGARCRLTLRSDNGKTDILLGEIGFGDVLPRRAIEEDIGKLIGWKASSAIPENSKVEKPTFKRTVVLYNGKVIKKEIDVTKVPRTFNFPPPPKVTYYPTYVRNWREANRKAAQKMQEWAKKKEFARRKWKALYDEALRQERREQKVQADYKTALALEKKEVSQMEEDAVKLSKDEEVIDSALENYKIFVEVVGQK